MHRIFLPISRSERGTFQIASPHINPTLTVSYKFVMSIISCMLLHVHSKFANLHNETYITDSASMHLSHHIAIPPHSLHTSLPPRSTGNPIHYTIPTTITSNQYHHPRRLWKQCVFAFSPKILHHTLLRLPLRPKPRYPRLRKREARHRARS